ncbi:MAG TPA: hypothetical protein PKC45_13145, partial [Gemmatales bacterium]|nr:hypothetical protein [Gemmatales bacterium]
FAGLAHARSRADILAALRDRVEPRISWPACFLKAFGLTAVAWPVLRRCLLSWPTQRLYQHPHSIASVAIERDYEGEPAVFFAHVHGPETQSLRQIDDHLRRCKEAPLNEIGLFRRALDIARWPTWVRRFLWWQSLEWSGFKRAKRLGTFGFSSYASLGAASLHPLSPLTCTLNYGTMDQDGGLDVRLVYDHRVLDGATVARALATLEQLLNEDILDELKQLAQPKSTDRHAFPLPEVIPLSSGEVR